MNRTANKYLRAVKRAIPFRNMRTRVMETLRPACESFAAECPDAGRAAYDAHFGTPEQIACGALESTSSSAVLHTVRRNRRIWLIALIAAALVLIGFGVTYAVALHEVRNSAKGYYIESPVYEVLP